MSNQILGEIDVYPWLTVGVETRFVTQEMRFLVDTGFDGEIAIPRSYTAWFGTSEDFLEVDFADGDRESSMVVQCRVDWIDGYRDVTAIYIDGRHPLLGMELIEACDCLVTFQIEGGRGDITVEPNQ